MSMTATQTVEQTSQHGHSRRFSMSSMFSAASISSNTPLHPKKEATYEGKYFQPDSRRLAAATDRDIIEVPVHETHMPRRKSHHVIGRVNDRLTGGVGPNEEFKLLRMSKAEYTKYWARDMRGQYVGTEPEGMGQERLRAQGW